MLFRCFIVVVLAHAALFWVAGRFTPVGAPPVRPPIYVEAFASLPQPPAKAKAPSHAGGTARRRAERGKIAELRASDLGIVPVAPEEAGETSDHFGSGPETGSPVLDELTGTVTYEFLYRKIDHNTFYPPEFVERRIEGTVRATLVFNADGTWAKRATRVSAASPFLRVHVRRILRTALREPLPASYLPRGRGLRTECVFEFEVTRRQNALDTSPGAIAAIPSKRGIVGRHFYFYRATRVFGEWQIGPLHGYGIIPSFGVDLEAVADGIAGVVAPKDQADALEVYRLDPDWDGGKSR